METRVHPVRLEGARPAETATSRLGHNTVVVSTDGVSRAERFAYWRAVSRQTCIPLVARRDTDDDFSAEMRMTAMGAVNIATIVSTPYWVQRTPQLIRQFDPENYQLMVNVRGDGLAAQGRQEATLSPGDMALYDSSRPFLGRSGVGGASAYLLTVTFPRRLLPLPEDLVRRLIAVRLPGSEGVGKIVSRFLLDLAANPRTCNSAGSVHVGEAVLELITAVLSEHAGSRSWDSSAGRSALLMSIRKFIAEHLADPQLSPAMVAAAHFISLRALQLLFKSQGMTVSGLIRDQRLERCRRDLSAPSFVSVPVSRVGVRWGFNDSAHFSRVFRAKYGVPPGEYRTMTQQGADAGQLTTRPRVSW
jgi:AraC-like DNA-binding protein